MELIKTFGQLGKGDADIAGGKGASLGEMTQAGIPVPPGFVVLAGTFERFIEETDLNVEIDSILHEVKHQEIHTVENASEKIQALILDATMPADIEQEIEKYFAELGTKYVAVRSSATAEDGAENAWAGQLDSFLNTTEKDLLDKVKRCWASLFTPRAIFYRFEKGLHDTKISVAVVVQKMVNSEISGIAFSVHPVTQDYNQLIIEAGYGLGEAIVSGQITPNSYVVEKEPRRIIDINTSNQGRGLYRVEGGGSEWKEITEEKGEQQVLPENQITELSNIIIGIENHYGFPCDIEWAFEETKFYIVQSRPITTLAPLQDKAENISVAENSYKNFNLGEFIFWGQWVAPVLEYELWFDYFNTKEAKEVGLSSDLSTVMVDGHFFRPEKDPYSTVQNRAAQDIESGKHDFIEFVLSKASEISQECLEASKKVGQEMSFPEFLGYYEIMKRLRFPWSACFPIDDAASAYIREYALENSINEDDLFSSIEQLPNSLTDDQKQLIALKAEIEKDNLPFVFAEIEKANPSLAEKIKIYQKETEYIGTHHMWGEERNLEKLLEAIKSAQESKQEARVNKYSLPIFSLMSEISKWRLECAQSSAKLAYSLRPTLTNFAKKLGMVYDDIIFLTTEEIAQSLEAGKADLEVIKQRQQNFAMYREGGKVKVFAGEDCKAIEKMFNLDQEYADVEMIKGNIGNKGVITGKVAIIRKPQEMSKIKSGMILVAPETTPDFIPAMGLAAAFITDIGGITSHAAIVAREMGKPCITGTKIATKVLKDGDMVEVDADNGVVRIIKKNEIVNDLLEKSKKVTWIHWLERPYHAFMPKLCFSGVGKKYYDKVGLNGFDNGYLFQDNIIYYANEIMDKNREFIGPFLEKNNIFYLSELLEKVHQKNVSLVEKLITDKKEPIKKIEDLKEIIREYLPFLWITLPLEEYYESRVQKELTQYVTGDVKEFVAEACIPEKKTVYDKMQEDIRAGTSTETLLERYDWTKSRDGFTDFYTAEEMADIVKHTKPKEIPSKIEVPEAAKKLVEELKEMIFLRTDRTDKFYEILSKARPILQEIAKSIGVDFKELAKYDSDSISNGHPVKFDNDFSYLFLEGDELLQKGRILDIEISDNKEIRGTVAYKGKVQGVAKVIKHSSEIEKVNIGDVLVAQMTLPSFMLAMNKAAAFVTDEGSITCHAAIVAREMKKPCIIGTKNASSLIKDGDFVEVDADKGIVRIIK